MVYFHIYKYSYKKIQAYILAMVYKFIYTCITAFRTYCTYVYFGLLACTIPLLVNSSHSWFGVLF